MSFLYFENDGGPLISRSLDRRLKDCRAAHHTKKGVIEPSPDIHFADDQI